MLTESQLDDRLQQWAREYGWGGMPREYGGISPLQRLIDHGGFMPAPSGFRGTTGQTLADEVDAGVVELQDTLNRDGGTNPFFRAANVLRVHYLTPNHWPEEERLRKLKAIGLAMSRHTYYRAMQFGRAFLMGYLRTPLKEVA